MNIVTYHYYRRWVIETPESQQTKALMEVFERKISPLTTFVNNEEEEKELKAVNPDEHAQISFDVFVLQFFQELYDNPNKGKS